MPHTLLDICINRIEWLSQKNQQSLYERWDMVAAMQVHRLLMNGNAAEKTTAASHTPIEVYETIAAYLDEAIRELEEEPTFTSYVLDHDLYNKLLYMAKHGLCFEEGELPI